MSSYFHSQLEHSNKTTTVVSL